MCAIISMVPGATINRDQLFNVVYNNWHGFGLIVKDANNQVQLIKEFNEEGTDPQRVWDLLEEYKDCTRYLHVRHATKGNIDLDNTQPFSVYNSNDRQVWFMHNGTLSGFGVTKWEGGKQIHSEKSDTAEFCERILAPSLLRWYGENGKADYTDPEFVRLVVEKQWSGGSTGLFISNDLHGTRIGSGWSQYKHPDETSNGEVWVSNTLYFDRVQRGPMFQQLEALKKQAAEAKAAAEKTEQEAKKEVTSRETSALMADLDDEIPFRDWAESNSTFPSTPHGTTNGSTGLTPVKVWNGSGCNKSPKIIAAITDIINSWDLDDPATISRLSSAEYHEWLEVLEDVDIFTIVAFVDHLCSEYTKLYAKQQYSARAHGRATKLIAEAKKKGIVFDVKDENGTADDKDQTAA